MAIDQRDWYRNLIRKRTGYVEHATFRAPANQDDDYFPVPLRRQKSPAKTPFLLIFLFTVVICGSVFIALKLISQFAR